MTVAIDTGLATTKMATLVDGEVKTTRFSSAVARGLLGPQSAGIYCTGKTQSNFQFYSVLGREYGPLPVAARGFRDALSSRRRILIEHGVRVAGAKGKTALALTHPVDEYFRGGVDRRTEIEAQDQTLVNMTVAPIDAVAGRAMKASWSLSSLSVSPESIWALHDLAVTDLSMAAANLREFEKNTLGVGAVAAIVDFGATGTRFNYVEWDGRGVPTFLSRRSRQVSIGGADVTEELERLLIDAHSYRDFIDIVQVQADPVIHMSGERINITPQIEAASRAVFDRLMRAGIEDLAREVGTKEVQAVMFIGGVDHLLGKLAREVIPKASVLEAPDPDAASVRGLLKARAAITQGGGD